MPTAIKAAHVAAAENGLGRPITDAQLIELTWADIVVLVLDGHCHIQRGPSHKDALLAQARAKLGGAPPRDRRTRGHHKSDRTTRKPVLALAVKDINAVRSCRLRQCLWLCRQSRARETAVVQCADCYAETLIHPGGLVTCMASCHGFLSTGEVCGLKVKAHVLLPHWCPWQQLQALDCLP